MYNKVFILGNSTQHYQSMQQELTNSGFHVAFYQANKILEVINNNKPGVVITALNLQNKTNIFDLLEQISKEDIPVIFISDTDDKVTFQLAMKVGAKAYFVKKRHQSVDIIRQIQLLTQMQNIQKANNLHNSKHKNHQIGLTGLTSYLQKIKQMGYNEISRKVVRYENIIWISNDKKHLKYFNYIWFKDVDGNIYYLKESLSNLYQRIPKHFARINDSYIVNLLPEYLEGRINGSNIVVKGQKFNITRTYKTEFEKRFAQLYG